MGGLIPWPPGGEYTSSSARVKGRTARFPGARSRERARRALVVVAAGGHNVLMIGIPGTGKAGGIASG
jgi:magnesium chelatase family protein